MVGSSGGGTPPGSRQAQPLPHPRPACLTPRSANQAGDEGTLILVIGSRKLQSLSHTVGCLCVSSSSMPGARIHLLVEMINQGPGHVATIRYSFGKCRTVDEAFSAWNNWDVLGCVCMMELISLLCGSGKASSSDVLDDPSPDAPEGIHIFSPFLAAPALKLIVSVAVIVVYSKGRPCLSHT
ncbi:hypothetical protein LX32DRAFT_636300 [Colletotrichum zoysiae]|uniref:Uncharacterized protein n=1 Tax=Colletotrichum zoysiae TaxID=1216348 RepID=A0AAD9M5C8_9PEZI|nr:hypothetical protein LX32DRAFT_636300 [Colletotrichum zoysiae]